MRISWRFWASLKSWQLCLSRLCWFAWSVLRSCQLVWNPRCTDRLMLSADAYTRAARNLPEYTARNKHLMTPAYFSALDACSNEDLWCLDLWILEFGTRSRIHYVGFTVGAWAQQLPLTHTHTQSKEEYDIVYCIWNGPHSIAVSHRSYVPEFLYPLRPHKSSQFGSGTLHFCPH